MTYFMKLYFRVNSHSDVNGGVSDRMLAIKVVACALICSILVTFTQSFHVPTNATEMGSATHVATNAELTELDQTTIARHARKIEGDDNRGYGEEYLDQILTALRRQLVKSGFARMSLPDLADSFSRRILGMTFYGSASLKNGSLEGLETIHRTGPTTLSAEANGDVIVESKIGVDDATVTYDAHAEFMGLGPSATVTGKLSSIEAILVVRLNLFTFGPELTKFDVLNTGDLNMKVNGLGTVLDFVGKHIAELVGNSMKHVVLDVLEDEIKNEINDIIKNLSFLPTPMQAVATAQQYLLKPFQNLSSFLSASLSQSS